MAAGLNGMLTSLALFLFVYGQAKILSNLNDEKRQFMTNDNYINLKSSNRTNIEENLYLFTTTRLEVEQTLHNVNNRNKISRNRTTTKLFMLLTLLKSGDVHPQPGPASRVRRPKNPCTVCEKGVISSSKAVSCDSCEKWTHIKCTKTISAKQYAEFVEQNNDFSFTCDQCMLRTLPFHSSHLEVENQNNNIDLDHDPSGNLDKFKIFRKKGLHFIHCNARSILPKMHEIRTIALNTKAAVISITETWLDKSVTNAEININNYSVVRSDRCRNGGGVCMFIRKDLAFSPRLDLARDGIEAMWIDILLPKTKPILIGTVYRPPKDNDFLSVFEEQLNKINPGCEIYILGDFNICMLHKMSVLYKRYLSIMAMFNFKQLIKEATRITANSRTLLDHVIVNFEEKVTQSGVLSIGLSDHLLTYCTRKNNKNSDCEHSTENIIKIRSTKRYSQPEFIEKLNNANWSKLYTNRNVNSAWKIFCEIFMSVLNDVAPIREVKVKNHTEPWITPEILELIKQRDNFLNNYNKNGNKMFYSDYCKYRNKVQREVKEAKATFFENKIEENRNSPKNLWKQFKSLGYSTKQKENNKIVLNIDNVNCHDSITVANYFNTFFTNVAASLVEKLPKATQIYDFSSNIFRKFYQMVSQNNLYFELSPVSEDYVLKELTGLNPSKSTGLDGIPSRFLRDGASVLSKPVTYMVNLSITSGIVPDDMKIARVCPIFKKNSRLDVGNYRPVSILVVVSKILEKSVYSQLEKYLVRNNILYSLQSGFRSSHSTDTCLIHLLDHIKTQSSKGLYTGMIMLDLQKAFDTVDHYILCNKLQTMGIKSTKWFESYLMDRKQKVSVNGTESNFQNISCGVPQGSILGPLLFLYYVNDMSTSISSECKLLLYADDSTILYSHRNPEVISTRLGQELESCSRWLIDNKLSLHLGKTECILFGSKRKLSKIDTFQVVCNNHTISSTNSVKYLGLNIDKFLSGEIIVQNIIQKINARLKFLYRQGRCLSENSRKTLVSALIQCHFDYACSSWYESICKKLQHKLQVLQNKCIRFIKNMGSRTSIDCNVLDSVGLLNVENRVKQLRLNHVHKIFYNKSPSYMKYNFTKIKDCHQQYTRSSEFNFWVPSIKGQQKFTFYYNAIKDWNFLPNSLKSIKNTNAFKIGVKQFLSDKFRTN